MDPDSDLPDPNLQTKKSGFRVSTIDLICPSRKNRIQPSRKTEYEGFQHLDLSIICNFKWGFSFKEAHWFEDLFEAFQAVNT